MQASRLNPQLSAWSFLFGNYNFNSTPIAPPGTKIIAHIKPDQRKSWDPPGLEGWYVGPALHHHRCVTCYFPSTRSERVVDTVTLFPHSIPFPKVKLIDFLHQTGTDLVTLLKNPPSTICPSLEAGDPTYNALSKLATILNRNDIFPQDEPPLPVPAAPPRVETREVEQRTSTGI